MEEHVRIYSMALIVLVLFHMLDYSAKRLRPVSLVHVKMEPHALIWPIPLVVPVFRDIRASYVKPILMNVRHHHVKNPIRFAWTTSICTSVFATPSI